MERIFKVTLSRFHRSDPGVYVVQGYFQGNSIAGSRMRAFADNTELDLHVGVRESLTVRQKYFARGLGAENIDREYDLWITLPEDGKLFRKLCVYQDLDGKHRRVLKLSRRQMEKERRMPDVYLETWQDDGETVHIGGWAVGNSPCRIQVLDCHGEKLKSSVEWIYRQDVIEDYPELGEIEDPNKVRFGFDVQFKKPAGRRITLIVATDGQKKSWHFDLRAGQRNISGSRMSVLRKAKAYYERNGLHMTFLRIFEKLKEKGSGSKSNYNFWRREHEPGKEVLEAEEKMSFPDSPLISIVVPLYKTDPQFLQEMIASVEAQTYHNWELCLSDGSGDPSPLKDILNSFARNRKIHIVSSAQKLGISGNTNAALSISSGRYIVFMDHDDLIARDALYEIVKLINVQPDADFIYSDEDKVSYDGKTFSEPHFKPDFNMDLLCSMNYICHLTAVSRSLFDKVGPMRPEFDGAQDYDFTLRCVEKAEKICHIPRALYHWRTHRGSTSENPASKRYAFEAGKRAVQAHFDRVGIDARVEMGEYPGLYRVQYIMPEKKPLVSIIIPNKDHIPDLDKCIRSIREKTTYPAYELIVVENNSVEEGTFEYYRSMEQQYSNFRTLYWNYEFNYSRINNFGAANAKGEYLLFLNNDTEVIAPDWIEQMLGPCLRPEVGAAGARLFYPDDTVQHAGVIIGFGGIAGHAFQNFPRSANGYFSRIICQSDLSAVTAACMMVKRPVFETVGGFNEELKVAFNDVDFCLSVRKAGYLVVYCPYAELYHYESRSRGMEDTPEKIARFNQEADIFLKRWPSILKNGDPYYNPNLTLDNNDFSLRR